MPYKPYTRFNKKVHFESSESDSDTDSDIDYTALKLSKDMDTNDKELIHLLTKLEDSDSDDDEYPIRKLPPEVIEKRRENLAKAREVRLQNLKKVKVNRDSIPNTKGLDSPKNKGLDIPPPEIKKTVCTAVLPCYT